MAISVSDGSLDHENATNIIFDATLFLKFKLLHFWLSEFLLSLRVLSTQLSQFLMHLKSIDQVVPPAKYSPLTILALPCTWKGIAIAMKHVNGLKAEQLGNLRDLPYVIVP